MAWYQFWKSGVIATDEAWVISKLHSIEAGVLIAEHDLEAAMNWVLAHQAQILKNVTALVGIAAVTGLNANPVVATTIAAANVALAAIAAYQASKTKGASTVTALAGAYQAAKTAQIAHAQAAQIVAGGKIADKAAAALTVGLLSKP